MHGKSMVFLLKEADTQRRRSRDFIINLKDKIQEFMLCLKGKIHRDFCYIEI
jgi:hypothetical protein